MDTKKDSSTSDVPTFKVARVGHDRKRKGGAFSFLRGGGARGAWSGATGGSGAAGIGAGGATALAGAGLNFSKFLILLLVSVGGIGAIGLGRMLGNASNNDVKKPKAFSMASREAVQIEGDTSNLPGNTNTIPNSLGYLSGSKDGLTPEERAKKEADAAAAAEAQRVADEEAAKKAEADRLAGSPAVDPNALLASAKADGGQGGRGSGGGFGKKFGALSSSMGSGSSLSGGAGMSGGVNRQFGSSGAITKGTGGQMAAMKGNSRPSYSKAGGSKLASSKTKGFARKQLANANAYSRQGAAASKGESAASSAGTAFDNNPGAGNVISGPGVGKGAGSSSGADSTPNPGSGGGGNGNPTGSQQVDCGADNYQTADGGCAPVPTRAAKDSKPMLTMIANAVMALLVVVGIISAITCILADSIAGAAFAAALLPYLIGIGAIIGILGVAMIAMGDYVSGGIATLLGTTIAVMSSSLVGTHTLTPGWGLVAGFGGAAMTMAGKMLDKGNHKDKAPEAAQQ